VGTRAKIGITVAVVAAAVAYMVVTTVGSGDALEYYKHVDEVMVRPDAWRGRRLQLHGNVVRGTIMKKKGTLDFRFALHRNGHWVDVTYSGLVPDSFRDCEELVVKGRMAGPRTFAADAISTKCPSKYDGKRQAGVCGEHHRVEVQAYRRRLAGR
jgi:cytochrome c-type biogenesis protein CcmE